MLAQVDDATLLAGLAADRLAAEFVRMVDAGHADRVEPFFARGAELRVGERVISRDEAVAAFEARAHASHRTRHALSNLRLIAVEPDALEAAWVVTVTRLTPDAEGERRAVQMSDWTMRFVREDGTWKVARLVFDVFHPDL